MYEIAVMQPEDYDQVRMLWENSPGVGLDASDEQPGVHAYLRRNPGLSLVARREGRIVGAVLCGHDGRRGCLSHLAVAETERRRGIGAALVNQCLANLSREGIARCNIRVYINNDNGAAFWRKLGWRDRTDVRLMTVDIRLTTDGASGALRPGADTSER